MGKRAIYELESLNSYKYSEFSLFQGYVFPNLVTNLEYINYPKSPLFNWLLDIYYVFNYNYTFPHVFKRFSIKVKFLCSRFNS